MQQLPDPNAATDGRVPPAYVMQRNIANAYVLLDSRVKKGELRPADRDRMIKDLVQSFAHLIDIKTVPKKSAWRYADILRQAGRWEDSETLLKEAVKIAPDENRRVNDSLQLARVQAHLGKLDEAFATVKSVLNAKPEESAPIMMSMLYEITPEAEGQGKDKELALLLQKTIEIHHQVVVDPNSESGRAFLEARPTHINKGWAKVIKLLESVNAKKELRQAVEMQLAMSARNAAL